MNSIANFLRCLSLAAIFVVPHAFSETGVSPVWQVTYDCQTGGSTYFADMIADATGNTFSFGICSVGGGRLVKLDPSGKLAWTVTTPDADLAVGSVAMDGTGSIIVGSGTFQNGTVEKFSPAGQIVWEQQISLPLEAVRVTAVTTDPANNIYAIAQTAQQDRMRLVKLSAAGAILNAADLQLSGGGLAADGSGVYVTAGGKLQKLDSTSFAVIWSLAGPFGGSYPLRLDGKGHLAVQTSQNTLQIVDLNSVTITQSLTVAAPVDDGIHDLFFDPQNIYSAGTRIKNASYEMVYAKFSQQGNLLQNVLLTSGKGENEGYRIQVSGAFAYIGGESGKTVGLCVAKFAK
jgi:hypothetical protein